MNTLRFYTALLGFFLLLQAAIAQQPGASADALAPLDVDAICAETPNMCVLAQRLDRLEKEPDPPCIVVMGQLDCSGTWPPDCGFGYIWDGVGCVAIIVGPPGLEQMVSSNVAAPVYRWPWWSVPPWSIPRPPYPYPWLNGPLPDPWLQQQILMQQVMMQHAPMGVAGSRSASVAIGTDKGTEMIPDYCLVAKWEEGRIPPECSGLTGLIRKLGLSPDDAPLLKSTP